LFVSTRLGGTVYYDATLRRRPLPSCPPRGAALCFVELGLSSSQVCPMTIARAGSGSALSDDWVLVFASWSHLDDIPESWAGCLFFDSHPT